MMRWIRQISLLGLVLGATLSHAAPATQQTFSNTNTPPNFRLVNCPEAASRHLKPTPRIEVPTNTDNESHFDKFPVFWMPTDLWSINSHFSMSASNMLQVLDRGYTHVSAFEFFSEWGDGKPSTGKEVPYTRRFKMLYNNEMEAMNPAAAAWKSGQLPSNDEELAQVRKAFMDQVDDGGWFSDHKPSQICALDLEAGPAQGVNRDAWEEIKKTCFFDPVHAEYGKRYATNMVLLSTSADEHPSWAKLQNAAERLAYLKFNFWSGPDNSMTWQWDHNNQGEHFVEIWEKYGTWVDFIIRNTEGNLKRTEELGLTRKEMPALNMYTTGYDDILCFGIQLKPEQDKYYFLRPDIAEGIPIWSYMSGAKGTILWQCTRVSPHWEVEEAFIKGMWRIARHPDIFNGQQTYVIPEVSVNNGHSWAKQENGFDQGRWGNGLSGPIRLNDFFNGTCSWPDVVPPLEKRIRVRAVVNGKKILVAAVDPWQTDPKAKQRIRVRIPELKFDDVVILYGRETYLGKATIKKM